MAEQELNSTVAAEDLDSLDEVEERLLTSLESIADSLELANLLTLLKERSLWLSSAQIVKLNQRIKDLIDNAI